MVLSALTPGRCNIIYCADDDAKVKETYCLTRSSYDVRAGIAAFKRKAGNWEKSVEDAEVVFRRHSAKTTKEEESDRFLKDDANVYEFLWIAKTEKMG